MRKSIRKQINNQNIKKKINKRKKNNRKKIIILLIFLLFISFLVYIYYKYINSQKNTFTFDYYNEQYDSKYKNYNQNTYIVEYKKNNETDEYTRKNQEDIEFKNILHSNPASDLSNKFMDFLDKNNIKQNQFSLYISRNNQEILSINSKKTYEIDIDKFIYLLMLRENINNGNIDTDEEISIYKSDFKEGSNVYNSSSINSFHKIETYIDNIFSKNDKLSKIVLDRYIMNKGISLNDFKSNLLDKKEVSKLTAYDLYKFMKFYNEKKTVLNNYFKPLLEEKDELFQKSIYTNIENINIMENGNLKYDFGYINNIIPYYYSICSNELTDEQIIYIGDFIDRYMSNDALIRNIE